MDRTEVMCRFDGPLVPLTWISMDDDPGCSMVRRWIHHGAQVLRNKPRRRRFGAWSPRKKRSNEGGACQSFKICSGPNKHHTTLRHSHTNAYDGIRRWRTPQSSFGLVRVERILSIFFVGSLLIPLLSSNLSSTSAKVRPPLVSETTKKVCMPNTQKTSKKDVRSVVDFRQHFRDNQRSCNWSGYASYHEAGYLDFLQYCLMHFRCCVLLLLLRGGEKKPVSKQTCNWVVCRTRWFNILRFASHFFIWALQFHKI